ncbi:hypothetical protein TSOC_005361, partial [Tetrabaena socialis]
AAEALGLPHPPPPTDPASRPRNSEWFESSAPREEVLYFGGALSSALLADLHSTFAVLRSAMRQHLEEEEIVGLPLLRQHFTAQEVMDGPEKNVVAGLKARDMAWFLRPLAMHEKREAMSRFGVPGLIQTLVLLPAVRKDARLSLHPLQELAKGERIAPPKKKGFLCFAA